MQSIKLSLYIFTKIDVGNFFIVLPRSTDIIITLELIN
jgi:hypothetical protein